MENIKDVIKQLQGDTVEIMKKLSRMLVSADYVLSKGKIDDYFLSVERLCIKSRNCLERYRTEDTELPYTDRTCLDDVTGNVRITDNGWLHIRLNMLLPGSKYRTTSYIGDTVSRLLNAFSGQLPYYDKAFMGIIEFCDFENHNSLDNDNKVWKMIPNVLKGRVIKDDSQFWLSIGLFTKLSDDCHCEVYVLPEESLSEFVKILNSDSGLYVE